MIKFLAPCLAAALLAGCGLVKAGVGGTVDELHGLDATTHRVGSPFSTIQTFWILDGASVINTQKTLDDHLVSWITGSDCSTVRASTGDRYCIDPPEAVPVVVRTAYCYKSLASVDCYDRPLVADKARFYGIRIDKVPVGQ